MFEYAEQALQELLRVTKTGGYVLLSVMSLLGSARRYLPGVLELCEEHGWDANEEVVRSGDLYGEIARNGHHCHMYRWCELEELLSRHGTVVDASATGFLTMHNEESIELLETEPEKLDAFMRWEVEFCREPGAIDAGTHIIAVVRRD